MLRPKLLLIDEISEGLQPSVVQNIAKALRDDREQRGTTILLVEQNLDFPLSVGGPLGHSQTWSDRKRKAPMARTAATVSCSI